MGGFEVPPSAGEEWDRRYAASDHVWTSEPDALLVELAGSLTTGNALDLGSGEGRNACWLAAQGWQVVAVDASKVALERVAARAEKEGSAERVRCVLADLVDFVPDEGAFDLVVVSNLHLEPALHSTVFDRAKAALAPGGHVFVVGHHRDSAGLAGPPDPERLYTEERLHSALRGLDVLRLERLSRRHEGHGSAHDVTDVVAWASRATSAG